MRLLLPFLAAMLLSAPVLSADEALFRERVAPIVASRCVRCHQGEHPKGELLLTTREGWLHGGENGPAIEPSDAANSLLLSYIDGDKPDMPKGGAPLSAGEVATIAEWINAGAAWPPGLVLEDATRPSTDWWSYKPVVDPPLPALAGENNANANGIDRFVLAKLAEKRLQPSPMADRRTLIRRLSFDLIGLPPTLEEIQAFEADATPQAYEHLLERLLASPHYGEHWARHWLDLAHYADTQGFERDQRRDNAWRYRDYVIRSLNDDKPYNAFLEEQIAGDALRPNDAEAIIATGFLAAGPWDFVGQVETQNEVLRRAARADDLDDMLTQVISATVATTVNCARCHDHKLDPIAQREYYALSAVFAGVKRQDRPANPEQVAELAQRRLALEETKRELSLALARFGGGQVDLADLVGGGNGLGTGKRGHGIDPATGNVQIEPRGFVENITANQFAPTTVPGVDGVVIPAASTEGTPIASTGLRLHNLPKTSVQVWDAIRNGPINSQFTTQLADTDYGSADHTLLSLHANAAITFDLAYLRSSIAAGDLRFTATGGYFGQTARGGASYLVYVDGEPVASAIGIGHDDGPQPINVSILASARFLTLLAHDNGTGISHAQIAFADARLAPLAREATPEDLKKRERLTAQLAEVERQLTTLPVADQVFAISSEMPPPVRVYGRGNPEDPREEVLPGTVACVGLPATFGAADSPDAARRLALAKWVTNPGNALTARVAVNRVWHYHFGTGLVDTPSDFGRGGGLPSHPELLDWLASRFVEGGWSLKAMHRLICTSDTYRQASLSRAEAAAVDGSNRWLWRMNPRRLEAENTRDAMLFVSGTLNPETFGPGYRDFDYQEEYAPVYRYITADKPELWRRSIYRFVVRTTPQTFLTTLDCPNPANLVPARNVTTTALQSLVLLNNDFVLRQAEHFAARIERETSPDTGAQARLGFSLALGRLPSTEELTAATQFIDQHGLKPFCRLLFNTNEFVYVD